MRSNKYTGPGAVKIEILIEANVSTLEFEFNLFYINITLALQSNK